MSPSIREGPEDRTGDFVCSCTRVATVYIVKPSINPVQRYRWLGVGHDQRKLLRKKTFVEEDRRVERDLSGGSSDSYPTDRDLTRPEV